MDQTTFETLLTSLGGVLLVGTLTMWFIDMLWGTR